MSSRAPAKYTAFHLAFTAGAILALFLPFPAARAVLTTAYFIGLGALVGATLFPDETWAWRAYFGTLAVGACTMVVGSAAYYLYRLDRPTVALVLIAVSAVAWACRTWGGKRPSLFHALLSHPPETPSFGAHPWRALIGAVAAAVMLALVGYGFSILEAAATDGSIRSPWDVVPRMFFLIFFVAALGTAAAALGGFAPRLALLPATGIALLAVGVAATVYAVGYGFDPFIHQATELAIFRDGVVTPKPLYYVGQYALVTVLARLLGGMVATIDTWLVPVTFALVVPCAYWSLRKSFNFPPTASAAAALATALLPLSSFVATTPQGFANAIVVLTTFMALPAVTAGAFPRPILVLMALAAAVTHPLAGVPLLIFVALVAYLTAFERSKGAGEAARWLVVGEIVLAGSVALPAMFVVNSIVSGIGVAVDVESLRSPAAIFEDLQSVPVATRQFMAAYDLTYSWKAWRDSVLLLAAAAGLVIAWRRTRTGFVYLASALVFFVNYVLLKSVVRFPFLIEYERSNYADRIWELTLFILAPMAAVGLAALIVRAAKALPALRIGIAILLAAFMTSSLYLAYPRRDKYESSRGWSTSAADVEAVRLINKDAAGRPFVVLANQSVSAAAVREFGFKRYVQSKDPSRPGLLFYYPIPTGDALYEKYLDMNEEFGTYDAAKKAMDLTGVDAVYYVVSYYWWNAQRIILSSRKHADRYWNVNDKAYVFKYERR